MFWNEGVAVDFPIHKVTIKKLHLKVFTYTYNIFAFSQALQSKYEAFSAEATRF